MMWFTLYNLNELGVATEIEKNNHHISNFVMFWCYGQLFYLAGIEPDGMILHNIRYRISGLALGRISDQFGQSIIKINSGSNLFIRCVTTNRIRLDNKEKGFFGDFLQLQKVIFS